MHARNKRLRIVFASLVVLVFAAISAATSGSAQAQVTAVGFDPQNMNVPYLAWRGDEVRLVKCVAGAAGLTGTFTVEDWSGDPHFKPQFSAAELPGDDAGDAFVTGGFVGQGPEQGGRQCFAADMVSQKAGLAIVKLKFSTGAAQRGPTAGNRVLLEHQFLVAWMNIASANVEDIGRLTVPASTAAAQLGTNCPTGDVREPVDLDRDEPAEVLARACSTAASPATTLLAAQNQVQVIVTGTIPMGNNFDEVNAQLGRAAGTPLTMPTDWRALAGVLARSSLPGFERGIATWDIHDEFTAVPGGGAAPPTPAQHATGETHQAGGLCAGTSTTVDEVDNCLGETGRAANLPGLAGVEEFGAFSRFIHPFAAGLLDVTAVGTGNPTIGPYDPLRIDTYLPNGITDAGDAPMPAARIDFNLNGVGALVPIDKHVVYSRTGTGSPLGATATQTAAARNAAVGVGVNNEHNLWAPFYGRFIPATAAEDVLGKTASGTDAGAGNNFTSFAGVTNPYHFWDFAIALDRAGAPVACPQFEPGFPATRESGIFAVTVYTDEHGEARVGFNGGVGFNFAALARIDANGCDLLGVTNLGTGTISAIARYPHQPVTAADVPGDEVVTKTVTSLFNKNITCVGKVPGVAPAQQAAFICTITGIGVAGGPFAGELVCVGSNAELVRPFGTTQRVTAAPAPATATTDPRVANFAGPAAICVRLNAQGQAQLEVFGKGTLNLIAEFVDEGIVRVNQFAAMPLAPGTGSTGPAGNTGTTTPTPAPTGGTLSQGNATSPSLNGATGVTAPKTVRPSITSSVLSARIVETKAGRKLVVRIKSTKATAKLRIVLKASNGRVIATAVRTVRTNRVATVPSLRIAPRAVRLSVRTLS